jgi:hypothetical protein
VSDTSPVRPGQALARVRWGPPRIARLDDLTPAQRDVVMALINSMKAAPSVTETSPGAATTEGHGNDRPSI